MNVISAYDSALFRNIFTSERMRKEFTDVAYVDRCVDTEIALARAQAVLGVIPKEAGSAIERDCDAAALDHERLRKETDIVGYPILPLIRQLDEMCAGESGRYLHWGATTQDIMDTAAMLQMKAGLDIISQQLDKLVVILSRLALEHRDTPMAGRTHLQHALPITFGYKLAVILSSIQRHVERLEQLKPRALMVQFGGAAGTLASLGDSEIGLRVRAEMARDLGLTDPSISWHVARDGVAEIISFLSLIGGTLGKLALDLIIMCSNEFSEVQEPFVPHRGASSTMPQKRNPISSEAMLAISKILRNHASAAQDGMVSDFERASGPWHLEWVVVPESFTLCSGALDHAIFALDGLCVDTARMRVNLDSSQGLIVGEAVMMGLAPIVGRNQAHDVVYAACKEAIEGKTTLFEQLIKREEVSTRMSKEQLEALCEPTNYLGAAQRMVDNVLAQSKKAKAANGVNGVNGNGVHVNGHANGH